MLNGATTERIVDKMLSCSLQMARSDADKETALQDIDRLEVKLATAVVASDEKPTRGSTLHEEGTAATKLTTIRRVKTIRSELTAKEELVKELDDRVALEVGKLRALEMELHQQCQSSDAGHFFSRAAGQFEGTENDAYEDDRPSRDVSTHPYRPPPQYQGTALGG